MTNTKFWMAVAALFALGVSAQGGIIPIGSSLTFGGDNAPDTYSANVTFSSTPVLVDNGKVKIWQNQVPDATGGGEWDVFYMQIVSGGSLAGNINSYWDIVMDYDLSEAVFFDGVVLQWAVNGVPVNPLNNFGSICCATSTNPIIPGEAFYDTGFSDPLPAGVQTDWQQVYVSPYSFVETGGIDPNTADDLTFALHFTPQQPTVPEPASLLLLGAGLGVVGLLKRRRDRA